MGALGFVLGYYLGMKQGPDGLERLRSALETVLAAPEVKALLERLPFLMGPTSGGDGAGERNGKGQVEQIAASFRAVAESETVQSMLAGGLTVARGLLERGLRFVPRN